MGSLKLYGMRSAYDEVMAAGIKRQHEPPRIVGDLLQSEIAEKQARSIRYQMTVAKLPLAKDIEEFNFTGTPINEGLVRELANGSFVADQRNVVLIGGTGTGKTHLAIAIARALIRSGTRGRFYNVVDLVNRLETETRGGKQGKRRPRPIDFGLVRCRDGGSSVRAVARQGLRDEVLMSGWCSGRSTGHRPTASDRRCRWPDGRLPAS
jgi:DNA replication protein DnaC